jgi:hypothetical protein
VAVDAIGTYVHEICKTKACIHVHELDLPKNTPAAQLKHYRKVPLPRSRRA